MKNTKITIEQAKQVLPIWFEFLNKTSEVGLTTHPAILKIAAIWQEFFVPVLEDSYYNELKDAIKVKSSDQSARGDKIYILEVREIDKKNKKPDDGSSLAMFPNKTQFIVGAFSSVLNAEKWMKDNIGFHEYPSQDFFYVLSWGYLNDYSPSMAQYMYDLDGNKLTLSEDKQGTK